MKKYFYLAALILGVTAFSSCTTPDDSVSNGNTLETMVQDIASNIKATFGNSSRALTIGQSDDPTLAVVSPRASAKNKSSRSYTAGGNLQYVGAAPTLDTGVPQMLTDNVFMNDFPNGENNLVKAHAGLSDLAFDFLYESNGEPVDVYLLYSHAYYANDIGIYCIEPDGTVHIDDILFSDVPKSSKGDQSRFWSMWDNNWGMRNKMILNGVRFATDESIYNKSLGGFRFQLPKGWKFGFWIYNDNDGKKFSEAERNLTQDPQVVTYSYKNPDTDEEYNLIGFEDTHYGDSDKDYNDIIMMVYPKQTTCPTGKITVRWITEDGTPLCPDEYSPELSDNEEYTGKAKEFEGYELVDPTHTEETKVWPTNNTVIEFVYKKTTKYTVNYICNDGCGKLGTETVKGSIGDVVYATEKMKLFEGHTYETADKASITLVEDASKNEINLYYAHAQTSYVVKYLEKGTNKELADPLVVSNKGVGDEVKVNEIAISGYNCTNKGEQVKILDADPNNNVFIYYYEKVEEPTPPVGDPDIVVVLDAINKTIICASDDFGIKYNQYELEYAYTDGKSASNLANLKLEKGEKVTITIDDINAWANGEKIYWLDLGNGFERACFDLRLYNCRDENGEVIQENVMRQTFNLNYIKKPEGYNVQVDCIADTDKYAEVGVHISVLVDRLKATE